MDRVNIRNKLQLILNFNRLGQYKKTVESENPGYVVEELVNYDRVNNRLYIGYVISNDGEIKILDEEQVYMKNNNFLDIYTGIMPEIVENFVFGDIENPGFYDDYLLYGILDDFDYKEISRDIINRYELDKGAGGYIITYYSPQYDLIGINVYRDMTLGILYYDLNKKDFINLEDSPVWIKVSIEEIY